MFSTIRHFARPLSALILLVFLAPAAVVECTASPLGRTAAMDCCHKTSDVPAMDPNCCAMRQQTPEPAQPGTPVAPRSFDQSLLLGLAPAPVAAVPPASVAMFAQMANTGPPSLDPLYLRLSAIRR